MTSDNATTQITDYVINLVKIFIFFIIAGILVYLLKLDPRHSWWKMFKKNPFKTLFFFITLGGVGIFMGLKYKKRRWRMLNNEANDGDKNP